MKFKKLLSIVASASLVFGLAACNQESNSANDEAESGGTLNLGGWEVISFDPSDAMEGIWLQAYQPVYDTLLRTAPDGITIEPLLAEEWEYSDDNLELTLTLRDDVSFTDGVKFNAAAVKANLEHFKSAGGPESTKLSSLDEVIVVDDYTVTLRLSEPHPDLLTDLSYSAGIMGSPEALGTEEIKLVPVGSGPYIFDAAKSVTGSDYVYTKNDEYWNPEVQYWDEVVIKFLRDENSQFNALASGQVDAVGIGAAFSDQAENLDLSYVINGETWTGFIFYDRAGELVPALGDVRVRQAINHALDKQAMIDSVSHGNGRVTSTVFASSSTAFDEKLEDAYEYDPDKAKALMADAGYEAGFTLQMASFSGLNPNYKAIWETQLAEIGITLDWVEVPVGDLITEAVSGKYALTFNALSRSSTWTTIQRLVSPSAVYNPFGHEDPVVTDLVNRIQYADDLKEQEDFAQELNAYLVEEAWFSPWSVGGGRYFFNETLEVEAQPGTLGNPPFYNMRPASGN